MKVSFPAGVGDALMSNARMCDFITSHLRSTHMTRAIAITMLSTLIWASACGAQAPVGAPAGTTAT